MIGSPFINYVHPGEVARVATFYRRRIAGEDIPPTYETVLKRKDGGKINAELNAGLITYQGRPADLVIVRDISERKRAEETLKAERHLFRTLMDNVPDAIYFKDAESRFVQINQAQAARFGLDDPSRAVGKTDFDFFTKEHAGPAYEDEQSILQSGEPIVDKEEKETWPDGHEGWVSTTKMPLRDHEGRIVGTFGVSHEITERKRAEAALNRRMEELTALGQAARVLTASLDLNKVLAEIVSLASKVTASDYTSVLLVDESGRVVGKSADNLPSKQDISSRVRINGTTDWIIRSRRPAVIDDVDGEGFVSADMDGPQRHKANPALIEVGIKAYVGLPLMVKERLLGVLYFHSLTPHVFRDKLALLTAFANQAALALENARLYDAMQSELTERKRTEQALADEGVRRRILIEQSRDGIVVLDENGKVYEANNKYAEMLGYTPEEAQQLHIWDWDTQWTREQLLEMIRSVDVAGDHFETKHRRKDGTLLDVEISTNGAVFGGQKLVFCVCRDITQRKRDEENLKAALKERDVMLREIHHRVKNNIQIISSLLRLQSRNVRDENALEILNESQNRIKSIALIHEKLYQSQDFARIDFAGYIDKMITHLFAIYKAEPDRVQYKVEAENIHLDINRAIPCGLIINELITNALKHA
ncbi:MAG: PAS domain S-box protein, partial [Candidatus Aminicenantales bacterium]